MQTTKVDECNAHVGLDSFGLICEFAWSCGLLGLDILDTVELIRHETIMITSSSLFPVSGTSPHILLSLSTGSSLCEIVPSSFLAELVVSSLHIGVVLSFFLFLLSTEVIFGSNELSEVILALSPDSNRKRPLSA